MSGEFVLIAEWDWLLTTHGTVLHHGAPDDPERAETDWGGPGRTACGLQAAWLAIPGLGMRMAAPRCARCCVRLGYPMGFGSPKNDAECRPLVERRLADLTPACAPAPRA